LRAQKRPPRPPRALGSRPRYQVERFRETAPASPGAPGWSYNSAPRPRPWAQARAFPRRGRDPASRGRRGPGSTPGRYRLEQRRIWAAPIAFLDYSTKASGSFRPKKRATFVRRGTNLAATPGACHASQACRPAPIASATSADAPSRTLAPVALPARRAPGPISCPGRAEVHERAAAGRRSGPALVALGALRRRTDSVHAVPSGKHAEVRVDAGCAKIRFGRSAPVKTIDDGCCLTLRGTYTRLPQSRRATTHDPGGRSAAPQLACPVPNREGPVDATAPDGANQ